MSDQADQLRKLVRETVESRPSLAPGLPIVAFSGGIESLGASTIVWEVAKQLKQLGKKVVAVDANFQKPILAAKAEVSPTFSLADVLNGSTSVKEALAGTLEALQLLACKTVSDDPPVLNRSAVSRLLAELRSLSALADLIVVDCGCGMTPWMQSWWRAAQQVILVGGTCEESIKGAYASVKLASWGDTDGKLKFIVNRCDNEASALRISECFNSTCRRFLGINVEESAPIVNRETDPTAFDRSLKLLATEIVSESLVTTGRIASLLPHEHRLPALPEDLEDSANFTQHVDL